MINLFGEEIVVEEAIEEVAQKKPAVPKLYDWLTSINTSKKDLRVVSVNSEIGPNPSLSGFEPFIIVKGLGQSQGTIGFANFMNKNAHIPKEMQYLFFLKGIPKNKSFAKWAKSTHDKNVKPFMEATGLSKEKSIAALRVLTKEQTKRILKPVGGKINNK